MKNLLFFGISILFVLFISVDSRNIGVYRPRYTIDSICAQTEYKQACITTLSPLFRRHKASPRNVLHTAISAVLHAMNKAELSFDGIVDANDQAISVCHEVVGYAVDELRDSLNIVEKNDLRTIVDRKPDLETWLSAVDAEQETCLDGFEDQPELRSALSDVLLNSTQLLYNALAIVNGTPNIFKRSSYIPTATGGGRLLPVDDERGYPRWMSKP